MFEKGAGEYMYLYTIIHIIYWCPSAMMHVLPYIITLDFFIFTIRHHCPSINMENISTLYPDNLLHRVDRNASLTPELIYNINVNAYFSLKQL